MSYFCALFSILAIFLNAKVLFAQQPAAGSASGYALRVQEGDLTTTRLKFSEGTEGDYPQSSAEPGGGNMTYTMWAKALHPIGTEKRMFLMGEAKDFFFASVMSYPEGFNDTLGNDPLVPLGPKDISYGTFLVGDYPKGTAGLNHAEVFDTWHHFALTIEGFTNSPTLVTHWVDGEPMSTKESAKELNWKNLAGFSLGQYVGLSEVFADINIADSHFNGLMDEVAIYNKALTKDEIQARMYSKLTGSEDGLTMYWNFDDFSESSAGRVTNLAGNDEWDLMLGEFSGEVYALAPDTGTGDPLVGDQVCRFDSSKPHHFCTPTTKSVFVPSDIPNFVASSASGYADKVFFSKAGATSESFQLSGVDLDNDSATLTYAITVDPADGSATVDSATGIVSYTPPSTAPSAGYTQFTYSVTSDSSTDTAVARILFTALPTTSDSSQAFYEDMTTEIKLSSYDPSGLKNNYNITGIPSGGRLFALDGSGNVLSEVTVANTVVETNRLKFVPQENDVSTRTLKYTASNIHHESSEAIVTLTVTLDPDKPAPSSGTVDFALTGLTEVDLGSQIVDADSNFVSVIIDELPINGQLYYDSDMSTGLIEKFNPFNVPMIENQYVKKVLEASSHYVTGSGLWSSVQIVGPPDAPEVHGDAQNALCFADKEWAPTRCGSTVSTGNDPSGNLGDKFDPDGTTYGGHSNENPEIETECWDATAAYEADGYSQFLTLQIENQVYIKSIKVGENRGAGSITDIEAYDRVTKSWQTIYSAEVTNEIAAFNELTGQYRTFIPYPVCQPPFKTDIIKVKMDTFTVKDWNEFDYIEVSGSQEPTPGILSSGKVYYEPEASDHTCMDNVYFSATDCGGQVPRISSVAKLNLNPTGSSGLPSCATPVNVDVTTAVSTYDPSVFDASYTTDDYTFSAVADSEFGTWSYDGTSNLFTFDWSDTDSDQLSYTVEFNVLSGGTIVTVQKVIFNMEEQYVFLSSDIEWDVSACNSKNKVEITYKYNADKMNTAVAGKALAPTASHPCAEIPAESIYGVLTFIISIVGGVFCAIFAIFTFIKKKHVVMKSSQPFFLIVYCGGCSLICFQMIFYMGKATSFTCSMRYWVFNVLFALSFGALFAKTWRVWRIFSVRQFNRIKITQSDTSNIMLLLTVTEIIILVLGQINDPYVPTEESVEFATDKFFTRTVCKSETSTWQLLSMAYQIALVLFGCYLSWVTRNVNSSFAESKYIMIAIYQVAIYGTVAAVVNTSGSTAETSLLVITFCCVFGAMFCVASVLVVKVIMVMGNSKIVNVEGTNVGGTTKVHSVGTNDTYNGTGINDMSDQDIEDLLAEVKALRKWKADSKE